MLKTILNLEGITVLNKNQQQLISGGNTGTCAYQSAGGFVVIEASKDRAISGADQSGGNWCCDSCCGASWTQGYGCD